MLDILVHRQQYVPLYYYPKVNHIALTNEDVIVDTIKYMHILFGGDQPAVISEQFNKTMKISDTQELHCSGHFATTEDWHTSHFIRSTLFCVQ